MKLTICGVNEATSKIELKGAANINAPHLQNTQGESYMVVRRHAT